MDRRPRTHLRSLTLRSPPPAEAGRFPFGIPALTGLDEVPLDRSVTVFAGENGSGKSTLLEAVALSAGLPTVGSAEVRSDESLKEQRRLAELLTLVWHKRTHRGFFLRAEDFFGFSRRVRALRSEMEERLEQVDREYVDRSDLARTLARGPAAGSLTALKERYGQNPDARSHGESFLDLFRSRFVPGGLYLLDEPEAALSPQSQLGLVAMIRDMVDQESQFILATHSPILAAIPGAVIYDFGEAPLVTRSYEDLESIQLMRSFLEEPARYLRHIWPT